MEAFRKEVKILDANRKRFLLTFEVTYRNGYPEFSLCGEGDGSVGQNIDRIVARTTSQEVVKQTRNSYHLKKINEDQYKNIIELIEDIEEENKEQPLTDDDIPRLQEELNEDGYRKYTDRQIAIAIMLDLSEEELENDVSENEADQTHIVIQGSDYIFGTDSEMNDEWIERTENAMDDYLPEAIQKYGHTKVNMNKLGQIEVSMSMVLEDRANELASYDGRENSITIANKTYYMYKC